MPLRNTDQTHGAVARFFHWAIVLLILPQWFLAEAAEEAGQGTPERAELLEWHISFGLLVLVLAVLRLGWRVLDRPNPVPLGPRWQSRAASIGHGLLYALILAQPVSGWLMTSTAGRPVGIFGWITFPALAGENHDLHEALEVVHEWMFEVLLVVAIGHVLAGLYHHWVLKDATLRRMLPFVRPRVGP